MQQLRNLISALMVIQLTQAQDTDITATYKSCMTVTPSLNKELLFDKDLKALMAVSMGTSTSLKLDWSTCTGATTDTLVQGVFINTDGIERAGCTVEYYVGANKCEDTKGVGVDAKGGVFNCNQSGKTFEAKFEGCSAQLKFSEIQLWTDKIMSVYGEPYLLEGSFEMGENDLNKIWGAGSFYGN